MQSGCEEKAPRHTGHPSELMRQVPHRSHKSYPRQHFLHCQATSCRVEVYCLLEGQPGLGGKLCLISIVALTQHEVENRCIVTHQIWDLNQPQQSENSTCKRAKTHKHTQAHISTYTLQTIWPGMPPKIVCTLSNNLN